MAAFNNNYSMILNNCNMYPQTSTVQFSCNVCLFTGRAAWQLPTMEIEFPRGLECYKWFASFLLEGKICPKLKKYTSSLLSVPKTMVKTWAK